MKQYNSMKKGKCHHQCISKNCHNRLSAFNIGLLLTVLLIFSTLFTCSKQSSSSKQFICFNVFERFINMLELPSFDLHVGCNRLSITELELEFDCSFLKSISKNKVGMKFAIYNIDFLFQSSVLFKILIFV